MNVLPSPGLLHAGVALVEILNKCPATERDFLHVIPRVAGANAAATLQLALDCGWICADTPGFQPTDRGLQIAAIAGEPRIREMLFDYVIAEKPVWWKLIPRGRMHAYNYCPDEVRQVLRESGLMDDNPNEVVIRWWDELAARARKQHEDKNAKTGRQGELLTINYESMRCAQSPEWVSFDNNLAGYDVLSILNKQSSVPLRIEVKASSLELSFAELYLSRQEWEIANSPGEHHFYLWLLKSLPYSVAVVSRELIRSHIPVDSGRGEWTEIRIPFEPFNSLFKEYRS